MSNYIIKGGRPLKGSIEVGSGKNSPIAILCACLMIKGVSTLRGISQAGEIPRVIGLLKSIGVKIEEKNNELVVDTRGPLTLKNINKELSAKLRISLLLLGALSKREKNYKLYKTGGCRLGKRTVKPHLHALEKFGVNVVSTSYGYDVSNKPLKAADVVMIEAGDTATENAIMGAILAEGVSRISFTSSNYMVQDMCHFLNQAGAKIDGIGTTTLTITGVKELKPVKGYEFIPDPIDAMAWVSLGFTTDSEITIKNCAWDFLALEMEILKTMGAKFRLENKRKTGTGKFTTVDITLLKSKLTAPSDKLHPRPYPGVNADNIPLFIPILTRAKGQTLVNDWMYENRAIYYTELVKLGANIVLLDPYRVLVTGGGKLLPNEVVCPSGIRPGMAVMIGMLAAKGRSILRNADPIERGYEDIVERLRGLGADISKE